MGYCPECEAVIDDDEFEDVGDVIPCPECGVELEVVSLDPVEFDLAPVDDEDEDDEFRYDDDTDDWDDEEPYEEEEDDEEDEDEY